MYTSTNNDFIKRIKKLNEKKYRDIYNEFLVEGEHLVLEALKSNLIKHIHNFINLQDMETTKENYKILSFNYVHSILNLSRIS